MEAVGSLVVRHLAERTGSQTEGRSVSSPPARGRRHAVSSAAQKTGCWGCESPMSLCLSTFIRRWQYHQCTCELSQFRVFLVNTDCGGFFL